MKIYKYTSLKSALSIIESNGVILNSPQTFNDIYDCVFKQDEKDKVRIRKLLKDFAVLLILSELANTEQIQDSGVVKFVKFQLSVLRKALKKHPFYTGSPGLVTIYNQIIKRDPKIKEECEKAFNAYQKKMDDGIEDAKENVIISCFSKRRDSLLMWSHYADSHRGICIEYNKPALDEFYDVRYDNKRPSIKLYKAVTYALAQHIIGNKKLEDADFNKFSDMVTPFITKSLDWEYEREVRCVFSKNDHGKHNIELIDDNKFLFHMDNPSSIYIGCRCDNSDELDKLINLASEKGIRIIRMRPSDDRFVVEEVVD